MVSKDQGIGGLIFIICALIAVLYIVLLFGAGWMEENIGWFTIDASAVRYWVIAVPVFIALIATKPIEEITSEIEEEAKEEKKPEKKTKK